MAILYFNEIDLKICQLDRIFFNLGFPKSESELNEKNMRTVGCLELSKIFLDKFQGESLKELVQEYIKFIFEKLEKYSKKRWLLKECVDYFLNNL